MRRCHSHVQHDDAFFAGVVRHRISTNGRVVNFGFVPPNIELVPVRMILFLDVKIFVAQFVRRSFDLDVTTRFEVDVFAFR